MLLVSGTWINEFFLTFSPLEVSIPCRVANHISRIKWWSKLEKYRDTHRVRKCQSYRGFNMFFRNLSMLFGDPHQRIGWTRTSLLRPVPLTLMLFRANPFIQLFPSATCVLMDYVLKEPSTVKKRKDKWQSLIRSIFSFFFLLFSVFSLHFFTPFLTNH